MNSEEKLIVLWAGEDIYRMERVSDVGHFLKYLLPIVEEEFGQGAEIVETDTNRYEIRVDKVLVEKVA